MEEALSNWFMDFIMGALGTAVFALIGFVWKVSHKVSSLEKQVSGERECDSGARRNSAETLI